ncbi:MAG: 30S ribosomal protein S8 [Candidatus Aenigmarchaeota archaeon]|nr:30S ribosomal protein S8 [Candidatus Aenigmarchaeota archaeon]
MQHDILADCFSAIKNAERVGKNECFSPVSSLVKNVLEVMKIHSFIEEFEQAGKRFRIKLNHRINDCNIIKPRFSFKKDGFEKWEKRYLPSTGFGILIVSTPKGIMTHEKAKKDGTGGKLLGYVY